MNQQIAELQQILGREIYEKYQYKNMVISLQEEIEQLKKELKTTNSQIVRELNLRLVEDERSG